MTINFAAVKNYSWMSQASYLDLSTVVSGDTNGLVRRLQDSPLNNTNKFATDQATTFTEPTTGYTLISHLPNNPVGLSATIFKSNADGSYTFAVRGTEPTAQLGVDLFDADVLGVVLAGKAREQTIAAYRYFKRASAVFGQAVVYSDQEIGALWGLRTGSIFSPQAPDEIAVFKTQLAADRGLELIPAGATVNFTGHSLGGHVAVLVAELVAQNSSGNLGDVYTFNAPGQNALPNEIKNWFGIETGTNGGVLAGKVLNIIGEGGLNVTAGLGSAIGPKANVFIETETNQVENHSIVKLSDSLAVYNLFAKLDPSLDTAKLKTLIQSASATMPDSLERALDGLRTVFLGSDALTTGKTPADNRDQFYINLTTLQSKAEYTALAGNARIESLVTKSADGLAGLAKNGDLDALAYRYALKELNPFAILGADYSAHNAGGKLDLYNAETGAGELSDQYLADRAAFLTNVIAANIADTGSGKALQVVDESLIEVTCFKDTASGLSLQQIGLAGTTDGPDYQFGGDGNDTIFSGAEADHLYGGAGMDRLDGGKGDDYLEGNAGSDILSGGEGRDTLLGGAGMDTLEGGKDNDRLNGGLGDDTYVYTTGDGYDTIRDSDGLGKIEIDGTVLTGGVAPAPGSNVWISADGQHSYVVSGDLATGATLLIDGVLTVENYKTGQLGLAFEDAVAVAPPVIGNTSAGTEDSDISYLEVYNPGFPTEMVAWGVETGPQTTRGNDHLLGLGGSDFLAGDDGADILEGGTGADIILGEDGRGLAYRLETINPVAWESALAGYGNDDLFADDWIDLASLTTFAGFGGSEGSEQKGDWLSGDWGNDRLIGSAGNDMLLGGPGKDLMLGGAGNDTMIGDRQWRPKDLDWSVTPNQSNPFSVEVWTWGSNEMELNPFRYGGADVFYAGAGNDFLDGGMGNDLIYGEAGNDIASGGDDDDLMFGGDGHDIMTGDNSYNGTESFTWYGGVTSPVRRGNDLLDGGAGDDWLQGDLGNDRLFGGSGNDELYGDNKTIFYVDGDLIDPDLINGARDGDDFLDGGEGDDLLVGGGGNDTLLGGEGTDHLDGDSLEANESGHAGDDWLDGGAGDDDLAGGGGDDILFGGAGNDLLFGDGDDVPLADQGNDFLNGGEGDDYLRGYGGDDILIGGAGKDQLLAEAGNDILDGGDGDDRLNAGAGDDRLIGGEGNDILDGGEGDDTLDGGTGNDFLDGGTGNDTLDGGGGQDDLFGGEGDDTYLLNDQDGVSVTVDALGTLVTGLGQANIQDDAGNNAVVFGAGTALNNIELIAIAGNTSDFGIRYGDDVVVIKNGFSGSTIARYEFADGTVLTHAQLLALGFDIQGSSAAQTLIGTVASDRISGGAGNDTLAGGEGADTYIFNLGDGNDKVIDLPGNNLVRFGIGLDAETMTVVQNVADDGVLYLDLIFDSGDVLRVRNGELGALSGFEFAGGHVLDYRDLLARLPQVVAFGSTADDLVVGGAGDDVLGGDAGNDHIQGNDGADDLNGGTGDDVLEGGAGIDSYHLWFGMGWDTIIEADEESSVLRLDRGLVSAVLSHWQEENDLLIGLIDGSGGVRIKNFFAGSQGWHVVNDVGASQEMATFLAELASGIKGYESPEDLWIGYKQQIASNFSSILAGRGFSNGGDGKLYRNATYVYPMGSNVYHYSADLSFVESSVQPEQSEDGRQSYRLGYNVSSEQTGYASTTVVVEKRPLSEVNTPVGELLLTGAPMFIPVNGEASNNSPSSDSHVQQVFTNGQLTGYWYYPPGAMSIPPGEPTSIQRNVYQYEQHVSAYELRIGATDDVVFGHGYGLIDTGDGNDEAWIDGYDHPNAYGSDYSSSQGEYAVFNGEVANKLGALLYGGAGDDSLHGGVDADTLAGGDGLNFLDGRRGGDTYVVLEGTGVDLIADTLGIGINLTDDPDEMGKPILNGDARIDIVVLPSAAQCEQLQLSWGEALVAAPYLEEVKRGERFATIKAQTVFVTLDISWGTAKTVRIVMPHTDDLAGSGIEGLRFADGRQLSMAALIALAPPAPSFDPHQADNVITGRGSESIIGPLAGAGGDDRISGDGWLDGGDGNDWLSGGNGDDILYGGTGDDLIVGGAGDDTFVFDRGDETDRISDMSFVVGNRDIVQFRPDVLPEDVVVMRSENSNDLALWIRGTADLLRISGYFYNSETRTGPEIRFESGTEWDAETVLSKAVPTMPTPAGDYLFGTNGNDTIEALGGNDYLDGGDGDDTLDGGAGNDTLVDNNGNTVIVFGRGYGHDTVFLWDASLSNQNVVRFKAEVVPDDVVVRRVGSGNLDLQFSIKGGSDTLTIKGYFDPVNGAYQKIDAVEFANETTWESAHLEAMAGNNAPEVAAQLVNQIANENTAFSFTVPADAFTDADAGDVLTLSATLADGSALPSWLAFDTTTRSFSGTPGNGDVGSLSLKVTATDLVGASVSSSFDVTVANTNDAPVVVNAIADQSVNEDAAFSFTIPADVFSDADAGDVLTLSATLAEGSALPSWLAFDATTGSFSGTPGNGDVGSLSLKVTATDLVGASVSSSFDVTVANTNDAPVVANAIPDQSANEDAVFSFTVPADAFTDADAGDVLTLLATLADGSALPSWLAFDATTGSFSGTPANGDVGRLNLKVTATDLVGASVSQNVSLTVAAALGETLTGTSGNDTIIGSDGNDVIIGGAGSDTLKGGAGNDTFLIAGTDAGYDSFDGGDGFDTVLGTTGDDTIRMYSHSGAATVERIDGGGGNDIIAGTQYGDRLDFSGTELINIAQIDGGVGNDIITGSAGDDVIIGGAGSDTLKGGAGNDTFLISGTDAGYDSFDGGDGFDTVLGTTGDDTIRMYSHSGAATVERIDGGGGNNVIAGTQYGDRLDFSGTELINIAQIDGGVGNDIITGSAGDDYIVGGLGDDQLYGIAGKDLLQGGDGNDLIIDVAGNNLLDGGVGNDTLTDGAGYSLLLGGAGNDTLLTGDGDDLIAFNKGDGYDSVTLGAGSKTVSLGGGLAYSDLQLRKSGNDLVLDTGSGEGMTFKNWYASTTNQTVLNLQVMAEAMADFDAGGSDPLRDQKVENFNFAGLAGAFDTALVANPGLSSWALTDALVNFQLAGSDSAALGGDLAYQYGKNGTLAGIGVTPAFDVLNSAALGSSAQTLTPLAGLQTGTQRLS